MKNIHQKIQEYVQQNPKYLNGYYQELADKFGIGYYAARHAVRKLRKDLNSPPTEILKSATRDKTSFMEKGENAELTSDGRIRTLQELIEVSKIDTSVWDIERHVINKWEVTNSEGISYENWQVKAWLKKIKIGFDYKKLSEAIIERFNSHSPTYNFYTRDLNNTSKHLLVIDPADCHIGKYASEYETGEKYNIKIAQQRLREGIYGIVNKARVFGIDKILLPLGNDWLHIDTPKNTTTSGTFQNADGMFYDMYLALYDVFVEIIDTLLLEYDVDIEFNPSNHDWMSGWMFMKTLESHYRNSKNMNFNTTMNHRKYYQYGKNLIATSHGDGAKMIDMPLLMANESPKMWAETKFRYVYLHHIHHKQVTKFLSGKDYIGVTVEYLRSPSASDSWHHRNGYVGAKKAIEGFLHSKEDGQIARLTHYF
jgi:hypothetical protein